MKEIGTIRLTKGEVLATDPCYDKGTWCTVPIKNVRAGNYKAYVKESDEGRWGIRIARLYLVHEDYNPEELNFVEIDGEAGVDAGVCGFFEDKPDYDDNTQSKLCDKEFEENDSKFGIAKLNNNFKCVGCWSSSGFGDGGYSVFTAEDNSGYVVGMMVEYISDEEEDESLNEDFDVDVERCKDILNNWVDWHEGEADADDVVDQLRNLESSGEISEAEYDYIMINWNNLLEF